MIIMAGSPHLMPWQQPNYHRLAARVRQRCVVVIVTFLCVSFGVLAERASAQIGSFLFPNRYCEPCLDPSGGPQDPGAQGGDQFVSSSDVESGPLTYAPNMIGDFFGPAATASTFVFIPPGPSQSVTFVAPPGGGASIGRIKLAENNCTLPRDRIFFDYNFFNNVPLTAEGIGVNRFVPGFEKTLFNGLASVEMRIPMATTLDSTLVVGGPTSIAGEFGNLTFNVKGLLMQRQSIAVAGGMGITAPTADSTRVVQTDGTTMFEVQNQSVHLLPYVALVYLPTDDIYIQTFLQVDTDLNGNQVREPDIAGNLVNVGRFNDQTLLYADVALGWWSYRDDTAGEGITGVSWTGELHYSTSMQRADSLQTPRGLNLSGQFSHFDLLNGTVGVNLRIRQLTMLTLGYSTPLGGDDVFDGELRIFANRFF